MSSSKDAPRAVVLQDVHRLATELSLAVDAVLGEDLATQVPTDEVARLLMATARLYAARYDGARASYGAELLVTPTEAVTVAAAMLRSQQLTPFEFAIWYSNTGGAAGMEADAYEEFDDEVQDEARASSSIRRQNAS